MTNVIMRLGQIAHVLKVQECKKESDEVMEIIQELLKIQDDQLESVRSLERIVKEGGLVLDRTKVSMKTLIDPKG